MEWRAKIGPSASTNGFIARVAVAATDIKVHAIYACHRKDGSFPTYETVCGLLFKGRRIEMFDCVDDLASLGYKYYACSRCKSEDRE